VYLRYDKQAEQDAFFALAAQSVFTAVTNFSGNAEKFVAAIGQSVGEHRVYVWSAHADEQAVIAGSSVASLWPQSDATAAGFGVYLADLTMSKIDWYVTPSATVAGTSCPEWGGHSYYELHLTLSSSVPALGAGLSDYIVGKADGAGRGDAVTQVYLAMPEGFQVFQTNVDGANTAIKQVTDGDGLVHYSLTTVLKPGATQQLSFRVWGNVGSPAKVRLLHTPTAQDFATSLGGSLACPKPDEIPTTGPGVLALG